MRVSIPRRNVKRGVGGEGVKVERRERRKVSKADDFPMNVGSSIIAMAMLEFDAPSSGKEGCSISIARRYIICRRWM